MISVLSQCSSLAGWTAALCLPIGAVAIWLWVYPASTRPNPAPLSPVGPTSDPKRSTQQGIHLRQDNLDKNKTATLEDAPEPELRDGGVPFREANSYPKHGQRRKDQTDPDDLTQFHPKSKGVNLRQVYPTPENKTATDVDIIAIHGLDTQSPDTWIWDPKGARVNWLEDPHMLPSKMGAARIFTCDWPADLLQPSDLVQKTIEEYALFLLDGIQRDLLVTDTTRECRPIFFIASCLGGIILAKALVDAGKEYLPLRKATRGIVFLATPFRGASFQDVAAWAEPGLTAWALIRDQEVNKLLDRVKGSTFDHEALVRDFTQLYKGEDHPCQVFNFYEKGKTSLPRKIFPWLPVWLCQEKQARTLQHDSCTVANAR
ncbi:hypothetical protein B0T14DRAFT_498474 [Immersiella caudata]|uniref:Uncharacterized protein n=1 Tax=Immersiella caudata TaxID=314043 RepID=A0AA40BXP9_9PEZI|nr:hypothetical protein B0T14DRAFT_498474 [Immersiella caudata]